MGRSYIRGSNELVSHKFAHFGGNRGEEKLLILNLKAITKVIDSKPKVDISLKYGELLY